MSTNDPGTLMWIGRRDGEFAPAYQFCVEHAAQIAVRDHIEQALQRRAVGVRGIVLARGDRSRLSVSSLSKLEKRYSAATTVHLIGALSLGMRSGEDLPATQRIAWYRWRERLPGWLGQWGDAPPENRLPLRSVAIVASHFQAADPLMELAATSGVTMVWLRTAQSFSARNFDGVWWDDSFATSTSPAGWRSRIAAITQDRSVKHTWIVGDACPHDYRVANEAGIHQIVTKPYPIDQLSQMLAQPAIATPLQVA